jgi:hypothetical protein
VRGRETLLLGSRPDAEQTVRRVAAVVTKFRQPTEFSWMELPLPTASSMPPTTQRLTQAQGDDFDRVGNSSDQSKA